MVRRSRLGSPAVLLGLLVGYATGNVLGPPKLESCSASSASATRAMGESGCCLVMCGRWSDRWLPNRRNGSSRADRTSPDRSPNRCPRAAARLARAAAKLIAAPTSLAAMPKDVPSGREAGRQAIYDTDQINLTDACSNGRSPAAASSKKV